MEKINKLKPINFSSNALIIMTSMFNQDFTYEIPPDVYGDKVIYKFNYIDDLSAIKNTVSLYLKKP